MQIDEEYMKRFAIKIQGDPEEVTLNGEEQPAPSVIGIDDEEGTCLAVIHRDTYESPYDTKKGAENRTTFVVVKRGRDTVGTVGYRFAGLITLDDLRTWYREKFNIPEPSA